MAQAGWRSIENDRDHSWDQRNRSCQTQVLFFFHLFNLLQFLTICSWFCWTCWPGSAKQQLCCDSADSTVWISVIERQGSTAESVTSGSKQKERTRMRGLNHLIHSNSNLCLTVTSGNMTNMQLVEMRRRDSNSNLWIGNWCTYGVLKCVLDEPGETRQPSTWSHLLIPLGDIEARWIQYLMDGRWKMIKGIRRIHVQFLGFDCLNLPQSPQTVWLCHTLLPLYLPICNVHSFCYNKTELDGFFFIVTMKSRCDAQSCICVCLCVCA